MSIKLMNLVWAADIPLNRKYVLLALADQANDEGYCWPSTTTLAWKLGSTDRFVRKALADLERKGLARREERPGRSNVYVINEAALQKIQRTKPETKPTDQPDDRAEQYSGVPQKGRDNIPEREEQRSGVGGTVFRGGRNNVPGREEQCSPITINEPTKEPKHTRSPSAEPDPAIAEVCSKLKIIDPGRLMEAEAMVEAWLGQGVPKAKLITLAAQASVKRHPLGYLRSLVDPVLAEVVAKREKQARAAADTAEENWPLRLEMYDMTGQWNAHAWGPMPGIKGCRVPPELLARHRAERQTGNSAA